MMRFFLKFVVFALLLSPVALLSGVSSPEPEYESATGFTSKPAVIVPVSSIRQDKSIPYNEENVHAEEWELYAKENWRRSGPPLFTPNHMFVRDEPLRAAATAGPTLKSSFAGIPNAGVQQPDSMITVGPNHIMLAVNTEVAIYTKTGQKLFETSFSEWFKSVNPPSTNVYDPKLLYDQYSGHYIFLCDMRSSKVSWYLFSVSKTSDPMGEWAFWGLDMGLNGTRREDVFWADFPRVGIDEKAIYLTGNMTEFNTYRFRYPKLRILKKSQVYSFGRLTWRDFYKMTDVTGFRAYSMEPVHSYGPAPVGYLVNTSPFQGNVLTLWSVTGASTGNPVLKKRAVHVSSYEFPPLADQKGGGAQLATRECGVYNAVLTNGSIYTAHNTSQNWGSGPVSAIRYYQFRTNGKLVEEATYGADKVHYFYPAVIPDNKGNVFMGFNRSSTGTFAGAYFTGRKATDPPGKFAPSAPLARGLANYKIVFSNTEIARWGDYAGIALDPNGSIYFYGQYAKSATEWATRVGQLLYP